MRYLYDDVYIYIYIHTPLRPHLEQVEHRHYPAGLSSAHALPSGCELSGEIAIEPSRGASIAIAGKRVGHLAKLGYSEVRTFASIFRIFRKCIIM